MRNQSSHSAFLRHKSPGSGRENADIITADSRCKAWLKTIAFGDRPGLLALICRCGAIVVYPRNGTAWEAGYGQQPEGRGISSDAKR
jgi:hypothetical protein